MTDLAVVTDPESLFQEGWMLCAAGEHSLGLERIQRGVAGGYLAWATLAHSPHFDPLRRDPAFEKLLADAERGRLEALGGFRDAGGERLLGK